MVEICFSNSLCLASLIYWSDTLKIFEICFIEDIWQWYQMMKYKVQLIAEVGALHLKQWMIKPLNYNFDISL